MKKTFCDRCGDEVPPGAPNNAPQTLTVSGQPGSRDLCNDCAVKLEEWMGKKK